MENSSNQHLYQLIFGDHSDTEFLGLVGFSASWSCVCKHQITETLAHVIDQFIACCQQRLLDHQSAIERQRPQCVNLKSVPPLSWGR